MAFRVFSIISQQTPLQLQLSNSFLVWVGLIGDGGGKYKPRGEGREVLGWGKYKPRGDVGGPMGTIQQPTVAANT